MNTTRDAFFQKLQENPDLQQKVESIQQPSIEAAAEALAGIARDAGFELTPQDFLPQAGELSESDLAEVAGGNKGDVHYYNAYSSQFKFKVVEIEDGKFGKWEKVPR